MTFDELYKKVINASKAFEERQVPIRLDFKIEDLRDALVESNDTIEKLVGAKKSAEQILQNLLDCGLIKEWYFNGKFNAVLKNDDPHLQIAELKAYKGDIYIPFYGSIADAKVYLKSEADKVIAEKDIKIAELEAENAQLMKGHVGDGCARLLGEKLAIIDDNVKLKQKLEDTGTENRKQKRALWLARASEASKEVNYWNCENESSYAIVDFNVHHETIVSYKAPHHRPYKWILIWDEVERKCRAMAERWPSATERVSRCVEN